jgi:hypothetical protein
MLAPLSNQTQQTRLHPAAWPTGVSEQPDDHINQEEQSIKLRILQENLNKSEQAHLDIINEKVSGNYNIILIQEPYATQFNAIQTLTNFSSIFPSNRFQRGHNNKVNHLGQQESRHK